MAKEFKTGHKVMLTLPEDARIQFHELKPYNGQTFTVKRIRYVPTRPTAKIYYELEGLESKAGTPYGVLPEWLYDIGVWIE